jgi:hypothetical protein
MTKYLGLLLFTSLLFAQCIYSSTPSPDYLATQKAEEARNKESKEEALEDILPDSQEQLVYIKYNDFSERAFPLAWKYIKHCDLLKYQRKLDRRAGSTQDTPFFLAKALLSTISFEELCVYLEIIEKAHGNSRLIEIELSKKLQQENLLNIINIANVASYLGIKPLIDRACTSIKEHYKSNPDDKNFLEKLKILILIFKSLLRHL